MKQVKSSIDKVLGTTCVILFVVLTCTVSWQVISRYVLNSPSGITEEFAKITFVWLVLIAAAYLFGERGGHMNIGIMEEKVGPKGKKILRLFSQIIIFVFAVFILIIGGCEAVKNGFRQNNAAISFITTGQIYMALPICGVFTTFYSIYYMIEDIKSLISK